MDVVFDMDGVIVDTEDVVRQSYLEVGVTAPDDVLGAESSGWFREQLTERGEGPHTDTRYELKHLAYVRRLGDDSCAPLLPPFVTASRLYESGHRTYLLTGAQPPAVSVLYSRLEYWPFTGAVDGLRTPNKMAYIRGFAGDVYGEGGGVYVDDQDRFIDLPDGWRFVRYSGQSADALYEEILGEG